MIIAIVGEPLSGKSFIAKKFIAQSDKWLRKKYKNVNFLINQSKKIVVVGLYTDEGIFQGVDVLADTSENNITKFINSFGLQYKDYNFLIEGCRISDLDFIKSISRLNKILIINLHISIETQYARRIGRSYQYSDVYMCGIREKLVKLLYEFPAISFRNESLKDSSRVIDFINKKIWKTEIKRR